MINIRTMKLKVEWQGETFNAVVAGNFDRQHLFVMSVTSQKGEEISTGNCSLEMLSHIVEQARTKCNKCFRNKLYEMENI